MIWKSPSLFLFIRPPVLSGARFSRAPSAAAEEATQYSSGLAACKATSGNSTYVIRPEHIERTMCGGRRCTIHHVCAACLQRGTHPLLLPDSARDESQEH